MKKQNILAGLVGTVLLVGSASAAYQGTAGAATKKRWAHWARIINDYVFKTKDKFGASRNVKELVNRYLQDTRRFGHIQTIEKLKHHRKIIVERVIEDLKKVRNRFPNLPAEKILQDAKKYINAAYDKREKKLKVFWSKPHRRY